MRTVVEVANPREFIVEQCDKEQPDILFMGSRGLSLVGKYAPPVPICLPFVFFLTLLCQGLCGQRVGLLRAELQVPRDHCQVETLLVVSDVKLHFQSNYNKSSTQRVPMG